MNTKIKCYQITQPTRKGGRIEKSSTRVQPEATVNIKHLFFLDVGQSLWPHKFSIQFHIVSYCSTIKFRGFCQTCCSCTFKVSVMANMSNSYFESSQLSKSLIAGNLLHLSLPRFQDIFPAMKSCVANIWVSLFNLLGCYGNEFANLLSKLNLYKLIPYPMDNC